MLNRIFISCESKVFTLFICGISCYARTLSLGDTKWPIPVSRNLSLVYPFCYGRQSVSLFFQRMQNCFFLGQILFALLKEFSSRKFIGTNFKKVIFSMVNWKSSKLCICHGFTKAKTCKKGYSFFSTYLFLYLKKKSNSLILEYIFFINLCKLYTNFHKRANYCSQ